jgi:hypothetical protein
VVEGRETGKSKAFSDHHFVGLYENGETFWCEVKIAEWSVSGGG